MRAIGKWSIDNKVTVNLIMIFLIFTGLFTALNMRREILPQFQLDMIQIGVRYPGAAPEDVEKGICIKIEERIKGVEGVSRVLSTAYEGYGSVIVELENNFDIKKITDDIKTEIDSIETFPEESKEPVIVEIANREPAITVAVYGDVSEKLLRKTAEKIRDDLVNTPYISLASFVGVRDYEISVEISEEKLREYGITFDYIAAAIKTQSLDLPGGVIKAASGEILLRTKAQRYTGEEFKKIPLITLPNGTTLLLGDIAEVIDGFEDADIKARFNGKPAVLIQVNRTNKEDMIKIAETVKSYIAQIQNDMPRGISLSTWFDLSVMIQERIDLLLKNGAQGIFLVFLMLALFLNLRLAFWTALGLPISFMAAFLILDCYGATINMLSLFAFIMTLGIIVDDAIIIGENVYTHFNAGASPNKAVIEGLAQVGSPVVLAMATTMTAFLPLLFIAGVMGKFIAILPQAVLVILAASLFEALVILPAHLKHALTISLKKPSGKLLRLHEKLREKLEAKLNLIIENIYKPAIKYILKNRYLVLSAGVGILIITFGLIMNGYVAFVFFPKNDGNWIIAEINYPLGSPIEKTEKTIEYIEKKAFDLNRIIKKEYKIKKDIVSNVYALAGMIPRRDWKPESFGGNCGEVWLEIIGSEQRPNINISMVLNKWRSITGEIAGIERLAFTQVAQGPAGNPIEIQLTGDNFKTLKKAANGLKLQIATYPGTFDITDNFKTGKSEKQFRLKEGAASLGVNMAHIAKQIRQAFYGEEAVRVQRGKDDVKVMVRYDQKNRRKISSIQDMQIRTSNGHSVPMESVADITSGRAYSVINRVDGKRMITVISDIDESVANANKIVSDLKADFLPNLIKKYPGIKFDLEGQAKRTKESIDSLKKGFFFALIIIFFLLASQFKSYYQPTIIMLAIPFGLIGAIAGHIIMGLPVSLLSMFGMVALSGIVVNDSLILIDFINKARRAGTGIEEAVITSGVSRFRPILLTSITTIAGLFPLLLEQSFQAQFLIPMAASISFGLLAATFLTLAYVPALYLIVEDIKKKLFPAKVSKEGFGDF
ncbi:MAG: efflux RND transporter permease subunit [Deltaproteobacteria bacterium]|nr:efflux RND transporter permease subunit [Deltaproteobacteria bacterium]